MNPGYTQDTLLNGKLRIRQPGKGYRFSVDALLLAQFANVKAGEHILELGAGCGVISLMLAFQNPDIRITAIEIQPELAELARHNIAANGLEKRMQVLCQDLRKLSLHHFACPVDRVIANPPFRKKESGRINPHLQQAIARHEISVTIQDMIHATSRLLRKGGRFDVIYCTERLSELLCEMSSAQIEPKSMQFVHGNGGLPARMVLVSGVKGSRPGGLMVCPPLLLKGAAFRDSPTADEGPAP
ncbi:tRNA1(Val) (adenine(37)-N6)-methyltransferase [Desulfatirhabdium butyrativorans]|uniref:tRNA1(Val) (adenine(37)-N6)-methyltransferase n=1 Tax=Desulfatirhabdium butyrativorans TaxID=340467 RepID=UPI0006861E73|nr:methyltransferase [Desulfatirhabdium butyrativorans]